MEEIFGLFGNDSLEEKKISVEFSWIFFVLQINPLFLTNLVRFLWRKYLRKEMIGLGFCWVENKNGGD